MSGVTRSTMMDAQAAALSQLLGCTMTVNRVREESGYHLYGGRVPAGLTRYELVVEKDGHSHAFRLSKNPNEPKRLLAILSDLIQMGFIKAEDAP